MVEKVREPLEAREHVELEKIMTNDRRMMGDKVNGVGTNILGFGTAIMTFLAAVFLLISWIR